MGKSFRGYLKQILDSTEHDRSNPIMLDFSNPAHLKCVETFFGGREYMEKNYPSIDSALRNTLSSTRKDINIDGFSNGVVVFDATYDKAKKKDFAMGNVTLVNQAQQLYTSIEIYKDNESEPSAYNATFENNISHTDISCESVSYELPEDKPITYRAYMYASWIDENHKLYGMVNGTYAKGELYNTTEQVVKEITVVHPVHIKTKPGAPILVTFARSWEQGDYCYPYTRVNNRQSMYLDIAGTVELETGYKFGELKKLNAILLCPEFGDVFYSNSNGITITPSDDNSSFEFKLDRDWKNTINDSTTFGDIENDLDFQLEFLCADNPTSYKVIISSKQYVPSDYSKKIDKIRILWGCLDEDSIVTREDGKTIKISEVKVGDKIKARDNKVAKVTEVVRGTDIVYNLKTEQECEVKATYQHPFYTKKGFVAVSDFDSFTTMVMADGSEQKLLYCFPEKDERTIYSLELEGSDNFLCNGFISGTNVEQGKLINERIESKKKIDPQEAEKQKKLCDQLKKDYKAGKIAR